MTVISSEWEWAITSTSSFVCTNKTEWDDVIKMLAYFEKTHHSELIACHAEGMMWGFTAENETPKNRRILAIEFDTEHAIKKVSVGFSSCLRDSIKFWETFPS
jgi:hypothetical protein